MSSVILTGATGNAGSAIFHEALRSPSISRITVLGRREPTIPAALQSGHSKVTNIILPSDKCPEGFAKLPEELVDRLKGHDAIIWAQGISQTKVKEEEYIRITHDYPIEAARALADTATAERPLRFIYMSGMGADQTEKTWSLFGKVKGRTEKQLTAMQTDAFRTLSIRPAGIQPTPEHAATQSFLEGTVANVICSVLNRVWPGMVITSTDLAKACLTLAVGDEATRWKARSEQGVMDNVALRRLSVTYE